MIYARIFSLTLVGMLLTGCSSGLLQIDAKPIERTKLELTNPEPLALDVVEWKTQRNSDGSYIFFLDKSGFETWSGNLDKLTSQIKQYRTLLDQYRLYYESPETNKSP